MTFAEFHHNSTGWNGKDFSGPVKLIRACGSDSIAYLDGRLALRNAIDEARAIAKRRGYPAFKICKGQSIREGQYREATSLLAA